MKRRQTMSWLIVNRAPDAALWRALRRVRRESGVLLIEELGPGDRRHLRHVASLRKLAVVAETPRTAARVHKQRELMRALLRRTPLILISPLYPTRSHPDWTPLSLMRAAALARLANRQAIALGGMDARRFGRVQRLGFTGWAGISTFRI